MARSRARALGGGGGKRAGGGGKLRLARGDGGGGLLGRGTGGRDTLGGLLRLAAELRFLLVEALGIAALASPPTSRLVLQIGGGFGAAGDELLAARLALGLLAVDLLGGEPEALQPGGRIGGAPAQLRQKLGCLRLRLRRFLLRRLGSRESRLRRLKRARRLGQTRLRGLPVDDVEHRLRLADLGGDLAVAHRLPRLPAQPVEPRR